MVKLLHSISLDVPVKSGKFPEAPDTSGIITSSPEPGIPLFQFPAVFQN